MASKTRNYKAEYQRRRLLAEERGLSIAQARGHARSNEPKVFELKRSGVIERTRTTTLERFYRAVHGVASGKSLSQATKDTRISLATFKKLDAERRILHRSSDGKAWEAKSAATFPVLTREGKLFEEVALDKKNASLVGRYWNVAHQAYMGQDADFTTFANTVVFDVHGNQYRLLTSVDDLISILEQMSDADKEGYERSFASDQRALRVLNHAA